MLEEGCGILVIQRVHLTLTVGLQPMPTQCGEMI